MIDLRCQDGIAVCACGRVYRAAAAPADWRCHWCALGLTGPGLLVQAYAADYGLVVARAPAPPPVYQQQELFGGAT